MLLRYSPFALVWLAASAFFIWLAIAPRTADPRYWRVDKVEIKLGSTAVFNAFDEKTKQSLSDAANKSATPPANAPPANTTQDLAPLMALPDDGIRIAALNPDLQEDSNHGAIPKITADGRQPWQYYARPFALDDVRPRLAIIVMDLGLSEAGMKDSLATLPGPVTFAFSPYADNVPPLLQAARDRGHETLVQLPLEVAAGSTLDVGTAAITSAQSSAVNQDNLLKLLSYLPGSVGFITDGGQRLVNNESLLKPLMENIASRGLLLIDNTQQNETLSPLFAEQLKMPWARSVIKIDQTLSADAINNAMNDAANLAKANGRAVVVAGASPLVRSQIVNWTSRLERMGVALAPISAVVTLGSVGAANLPAQQSAPNVMQSAEEISPETIDEPAAGTPAPAEAPINLLNPAGADPLKPVIKP
jgi:polysaccharide deacetylase 2 family uncharacterized protein YibQ